MLSVFLIPGLIAETLTTNSKIHRESTKLNSQKTHLFQGFQIHQATNTTKELDPFWCCLSQCCRTWHHQIIKLESVGPAVYAACQLKIRLRTTLFLKTLFYSFTILQILSTHVSATSFINGIELQLIQEIWGVPMLLSPVSARSFMRVTLSYYTTYWWRYKYCYFVLSKSLL